MAKDGGVVHDSGGQCGWPGRGLQGIAPAVQRSEWAKSTDMATTMWATLQADGFEPPFSSGKDVSLLTVMTFYLDKKSAKAVANLTGIDIRIIAYKEIGWGTGEHTHLLPRVPCETEQGRRGWSVNRRANRGVRLFSWFPGDLCDACTGPERNGGASATQGKVGRGDQTSSGILSEEAGVENAVALFYRRLCRIIEGRDGAGHASSAVRGEFPTPR